MRERREEKKGLTCVLYVYHLHTRNVSVVDCKHAQNKTNHNNKKRVIRQMDGRGREGKEDF